MWDYPKASVRDWFSKPLPYVEQLKIRKEIRADSNVCHTCSGDLKCYTCDGTGEIEHWCDCELCHADCEDCYDCGGSGKCQKCKGEG